MSAPPPRQAIPRSPAGLLTTTIPADDRLGASPSAQSALSASGSSASTPSHMHNLKRRSTETSGGLDDYYFSSYAGVGSSSSTSSLSMSPGPSHELMLGSSPTTSTMGMSRGPSRQGRGSQANLHDLIHEEEEAKALADPNQQYMSRLPRPPYSRQLSSDSRGNGSGPSSHRVHITTQSNTDPASRLQPVRQDSVEDGISPGGYSHSSNSHYSSSEMSSDNESFGFDVNGAPLRGLLGPRELGWARSGSRIEVRESVDSAITLMDQHTTPLAPLYHERPQGTPPNFRYAAGHLSPYDPDGSGPTSPISERTPTMGGPVMSSGRMASIAQPDTSRSADFVAGRMNGRGAGYPTDVPKSAPPIQSEFGINTQKGEDEEGEETIKGRNRMTMPPISASGIFGDGLLSPDKEAPARDSSSPADSTASPSKSPQPPPRSSLRPQNHYPSPAKSSSRSKSDAPLQEPGGVSPKSRQKALPTIVNTDPSPQRINTSVAGQTSPSRPARSPTRSFSSINSSATINDLTEMLGGAIDAIGLIDSRDTPPPTVTEPRKDRGQSVPALAAAAELYEPSHPPNGLPTRGASLPGGTIPFQLPSARGYPTPVHRVSEDGEFSPVGQQYLTTQGIPTPRPWPAAMMYGGIKRLRGPGDRAKAYAKAINELARAESGLKEWCTASIENARRPITARPSKASLVSNLGLRSPNFAALVPEPMHPRQVSAGSEFPMRSDSYTAREISTRLIDPLDQPTALPQNLPYPQLQQQFRETAGGMKPSPSMQSMVSVSSKKSFFSAAIGRIGGKKENSSLGPPSGAYNLHGLAGKKDIRGLAISGPTASPGDASTTRPSTSSSAPMGPRNPRGSYTASVTGSGGRSSIDMPSRASLDQGLSRMNSTRASLDSPRQGKMSAPPRSGSMAKNSPSINGPPGTPVREEEVRQMADVLPSVERGVLRMYLQKHKDPMRAIGAYLEDEKRGAVPR